MYKIDISELQKNAISKPRNPVIARIFRWAKLSENAGFGFDKMLVWKNKVEFDTKIDYSEVTFFLDKSTDKVPDGTPIGTPTDIPIITKAEQSILFAINQKKSITREIRLDE